MNASVTEAQLIKAGLVSAIDRRGWVWFIRWAELGCDLTSDENGNLKLVAPASCSDHVVAAEIAAMRHAVLADPLLAHSVARALLNHWRWEDAGGAA